MSGKGKVGNTGQSYGLTTVGRSGRAERNPTSPSIVADLCKEGGAKKVRESGAPYFTNKQKNLLDAAEHLSDDEFEDVLKYMGWVRARRGKC